MSSPHYYSLRRFTPYQGVIQVVDVGNARAYSTNGRNWQVRLQQPSGRRYGSVPGRDRIEPATADQLMRALHERPSLPFPPADSFELWLLHRDRLSPLALIKTRCRPEDMGQVEDPAWRPFLPGQTGFRSASIEQAREQGGAPRLIGSAAELLQRLINGVARPQPVLQWIARRDDGSGLGQHGLRVDSGLLGRELPAAAFPPLLISEDWDSAIEAGLVRDYHDWQAARLLAHQDLPGALRARLEAAARQRPEPLLDNHAMYPEVLDPAAMEVALVSARLIRAAH